MSTHRELADHFEPVPTPAFEDRFRYNNGNKVACVMCGQAGYHPGFPRKRSWSNAHEHHVLCTCGAIISRKGIGSHRAAKRRHGDPCPPYPGERRPRVEVEVTLTQAELTIWVRRGLSR